MKATPSQLVFKPVFVLVQHYDEVHRVLSISPPTLESLVNKFYQAHYIDQQVKAVINQSEGRVGARTLLDHLVMKVEQSSEHLLNIIGIMGLEVSLQEIVHKMNSCREKNSFTFDSHLIGQNIQAIISTTGLSAEDLPDKVSTAVVEAEILKKSYVKLSLNVTSAVMALKIDVTYVKLMVSLFYNGQNSSLQAILADIENVDTADAAIRFMLNKNLTGYLNFKIFGFVFSSLLSNNAEVIGLINKYEEQLNQFIRSTPLKALACVFKKHPHLRPVTPTNDISNLKFILNESWENRSLYQWNEVMADVEIIPDHLMITEIDNNCITISYTILPFFLSTVVKQLADDRISKALANVGVSFNVDEDLMKIGLMEMKHISLTVEHASELVQGCQLKPKPLIVDKREVKPKFIVVPSNEKEQDQSLVQAHGKLGKDHSDQAHIPKIEHKKFINFNYLSMRIMAYSLLILIIAILLGLLKLDADRMKEQASKITEFERQLLAHFSSSESIPQWYIPMMIVNGPNALHPPCIRAMTSFSLHKLNGNSWYSQPFYTGPRGYKLQLRIDTATAATSTADSVSVGLYLMKGENDDYLGWPFKGSVAVKLLNWIENKNHLELKFDTSTLLASAADSVFNRVIDGSQSTEGLVYKKEFVSLNLLKYNPEYKTQYLMKDVLCFVINGTNIITGYQQLGLFPEWSHPMLSFLHYGKLPVYRTITIKQFTENNDELFTEPFYTKEGYKLTLGVYPNGYELGKDTDVSVYIHLMKGPNDDDLQFPISGIFYVQILNWEKDSQHEEKCIQFDDIIPLEERERVITGNIADGWGESLFLSHNELLISKNVQYLMENKMCFKISFEPIPIQKGSPAVPIWCADSNPATPPCTRTLHGYSVYKKNNCLWQSHPFYSGDKGYKLQLRVYANGFDFGEGNFVALFVHLMKGEYDDTLSWPMKISITVQLLNWSEDNHHEEILIDHCMAPLEDRERRKHDRVNGGWGYHIISHAHLQQISVNIKYIEQDKIVFKVIRVEYCN